MKNILAAVDFSPGTRRVVTCAVAQARAFSARLWLVHVAAPEPDFVPHVADPPVMRDQVAAGLREEHRHIQALAAEVADEGVEVTPLLIAGATVEKILSEAEEVDADLVVAGTHGHGAFHRALLGSVSEGLVRHARVPLLIVPVGKA